MAKVKRNTKVAKLNRIRVNYHREWNRILVKESIQSTTKTSFITKNCANPPQCPPQENQDDKKFSIQEQLRQWTLKYNISKCAVSALLKILISFGFTWLPKDSRALLCTPRNIEIDALTNGKLWYNGIKKNLDMIFANEAKSISEIGVFFNMDGLPIFNSSKFEFWPILGRIFGKYIFNLSVFINRPN